MSNDKQLTFDAVKADFTKERGQQPSTAEMAKTVEQKKALVLEHFKVRMVKLDKPLKVGTDQERGDRNYDFDFKYPDDGKIQGYRCLTDAKELGPLIMIPKIGQEIFYCPEGIDQRTGSARAMRIDADEEEFLRIWNG